MNDYLNIAGMYWGIYFGWFVVQNSVFLAMIFIGLHLLRHTPARVRYIAGVIGLVKLLLPPFLPLVLPRSTPGLTAGLSAVTAGDLMVLRQTAPPSGLNMWGLLFVVWLSTACCFFLVSLFSTIKIRRKLDSSTFMGTVPGTRIKTYKSDYITSPMSVGLLPKKLFFPPFWLQLPVDCRTVLTAHELAHIRRRDGILQLLQVLVQAFYFFHPLVWLLNERIYEYREMACDDEAVEKCRLDRAYYSRYLVHMADRMLRPQWSHSPATALIKRRHKLMNRIQYLMEEQKMQKISRVKFGSFIAALVLLMLPLSWYVTRPNGAGDRAQAVETDTKPVPATTGKIIGQVFDKKSSWPLPGANVLVVGTTMGAATDMDGNFFIIHVPPGKYKVRVRFMGYKTVETDNVTVKVNESTPLNFHLERAIIQSKELVVPPADPAPPAGGDPAPPPPPAPEKKSEIFIAYDQPPEPVGGFEAVADKIKYPAALLKEGQRVHTIVTVTVDINGFSKDVKIRKSSGVKELDAAAVKAIETTTWHPARQREKVVETTISFPVAFEKK